MLAQFKGDLLISRSNYIEWEPNAILYLKINGYMLYINGSKKEPDRSLYYKDTSTAYSPELAVKYIEQLSDYEDNQNKAFGALQSILSIDNIERFKDANSPSEL
jgi:hypothetical protein